MRKQLKNAARKKSTRTERNKKYRLQLAKEVLFLLDAKAFRPRWGRYMTIDVPSYQRYVGKELGDVLGKIRRCEVCALGALVVADVMIRDNFRIRSSAHQEEKVQLCLFSTVYNRLGEFFPVGMLLQLENLFESGSSAIYDFVRSRITERTATSRLRYLMENVVRNDGDFVPPIPLGVPGPRCAKFSSSRV